jgi:hypothetical protein
MTTIGEALLPDSMNREAREQDIVVFKILIADLPMAWVELHRIARCVFRI